jgi:hypothetical protein
MYFGGGMQGHDIHYEWSDDLLDKDGTESLFEDLAKKYHSERIRGDVSDPLTGLPREVINEKLLEQKWIAEEAVSMMEVLKATPIVEEDN